MEEKMEGEEGRGGGIYTGQNTKGFSKVERERKREYESYC